ncbi:uncharacterized protein (DUF2252 family) [Streptacidiphilus sp. MAP12-16]|uniref:DUF2252 domain-containing protein n=1 Tax=Streptacidiphilus sp. MAP12-16 TaxID=3156300 RepID=UPI00351273A2
MAYQTIGRGQVPVTPRERADRGRAARRHTPRSGQGDFEAHSRGQDPLEVIERQSASRVPELVPLRYGRMAESPFRFYRGAAAVMASDLAATPVSGLRVQLCGDAHLMNFRLLGSPERNLLFDINDFDETLPGPWEWDVKRLAASFVIAGRENGFTDRESSAIVRTCARSYREAMRSFAALKHLDVWYTKADARQLEATIAPSLTRPARKRLHAGLSRARTRDSRKAFDKLTQLVDGERRITSSPPLVTPLAELLPPPGRDQLQDQLRALITDYARSLPSERRHLLQQFTVVDMARKVVGVGSVGTRCWIILLLGRDGDDPLFLQAKEAQRSVLADFAGESVDTHQGERVVAGQRLMQAASDIFLGWKRTEGIDGKERDFYVRQLRDWKGIPQPSLMVPRDMDLFARLCGATLARAHARSGDRIAIAAYLGRSDVFDRAVARFATAYADQNERDHQALVNAITSGHISARTE